MSAVILLKTVEALSQFGAAFQLHAKTDGTRTFTERNSPEGKDYSKTLMFHDVFIITC